jgi:hypothetical protein
MMLKSAIFLRLRRNDICQHEGHAKRSTIMETLEKEPQQTKKTPHLRNVLTLALIVAGFAGMAYLFFGTFGR